MKSTHKVEVVPIYFEKHPNADTLSIIPIFDYTYVGKTEDWMFVKFGAWIPPDSLVDTTRPEFNFLAKEAKFYEDSYKKDEVKRTETPVYARIKAKKLRGILSYGFMVPAPEWAKPGDDLAEHFGVKHYEAELIQVQKKNSSYITGGEVAPAPEGIITPYYDVDSLLRYANCFIPGEEVVVMEKIEGCNGAFTYIDGMHHCKSRSEWKKEFPSKPVFDEERLKAQGLEAERIQEIKVRMESWTPKRSIWWEALLNDSALYSFLMHHPGYVVYGEVYGHVGGFPYDSAGKPKILAFDIMVNGRFLNFDEARELALWSSSSYQVNWAPLLYRGPFDLDKIKGICDNLKSFAGNHLAEGVVVRPTTERWHPSCGRVQLKMKTPEYLEKK